MPLPPIRLDPDHSADPISRRAFVEKAIGIGAGLGLVSGCASVSMLSRGEMAGIQPLRARSDIRAGELSLGNDVIEGRWTVADGAFRARQIADLLNGVTVALPESAFLLRLADGSTIPAAEMQIISGPHIDSLDGNRAASRMSERVEGRQATIVLEDRQRRVQVTWRGVLREGSRYLRQEVTLRALGDPVPLREIVLLDLRLIGASVTGSVKGSPVVAGERFLGFEHPLSSSTVEGDRVRCALARELPLRAGATVTVSSVIGVTRAGQRRRDFLAYVER